MHITSPQRDHPDAVVTTMEHAPTGALGFWRAKLGGDLPVLELPADRPRPAARQATRAGDDEATSPVRAAPVRIGTDAVRAQRRLADDEDVTPFVVALAGYKVFLARLARQRDVVVGTVRSGPVVLRTALDGQPTFREVIRRVRATVQEADAHGGVPLQWLLDELRVPRVPGVPPLFQATFRYSDPADDTAAGAPGPADLSVSLRDDADELTGEVECAADLFDQSTVTRFAAILEHLLGQAAAEPDVPVSALPLLPPDERERILHRLHRYERPDIGYTTMAQPFEEQARRTPDLPAVVGDLGSLTYAELNARANRLAWFLRGAGARPGAFVAVSMERGIDLMVALYAVAKTGAGYVPIDPELPDARMAFMLEDSAPVAALVDRATRVRLPTGPWLAVPVDGDGDRWAGQPAHDLPPEPGNHLIHMIYTSGTTGRPKAVAYPVDGALADIFWMQEHYPYRPGDTAILKTSYGFDVSIWEIFWPLYCGARVAVCPPGGHRDPVRLRDFIDQHRVTAMFMVPTMLQPFVEHTEPGGCASLRRVYVGGEPVSPRVRDRFQERFAADLVNCYGPTELGCVAETVLPVEPGAPVVVGLPPAHRRAYVLDDNLEPAPIGVAGELFVGGEVGIAQSYHHRPALTAERFVADPYGPPGGRMYRTGDLCRYREDGVLEHLGRTGRQVKVRGMRIELAEIEAIFAEHEDVGQCVVTVVPDRDGEIAAFVVPAGGRTLSMPALLSHAASLLPTHMRPATVTVVERIPTFVHGKVDFGALLSRIDRPGGTAQAVAPANELERRVARIYGEILGRDGISVTDSFIDLGGHSLLILKLVEVCAAEFQVDLSIEDVIRALSARELAAAIARSGAAGGGPT
jgi:amino acid adenylation domain-containing protein